MLRRRTVVAAKIESTYGDDASPVSATDSMLCYDADWKPGLEDIERNPYRSSLSRLMPRKGVQSGTLTFKTEILGSGTVGTAPAISPILRACGYKIASDAAGVVYYPEDDQTLMPSCTIYVWMDGYKFVLLGCRGNVEFNFEAGKVGVISFTIEPKSWTKSEEAFPTDGGYPSTVPATCVNCNFTIGGYSAVVPVITINSGNTLAKSMSVNTTSGVVAINVTDRKMTGSFAPETVLAATHDFFSEWQNGNKADWQITVGSASGNTIKFTAPRVIYTGLEFQERDGLLTHNLPFMCAGLTASINGTADAGSVGDVNQNDTTHIKDTSIFTTNDNYNGAIIKFTSGDNNNSVRLITDVVASTKIATFYPALANAVTADDTYQISNVEVGIAFA